MMETNNLNAICGENKDVQNEKVVANKNSCDEDEIDPLRNHGKQTQPLENKNISNALNRISKRTKSISDKLAAKQQELKVNKGNKHRTTESDMRVSEALKNMSCPKEDSARINVSDKRLWNGFILKENSDKKLREHTKNELVNIIKGFEELMIRLTKDDKKLHAKAKKLVYEISSLNNLGMWLEAPISNTFTSETKRVDSNSYQKGSKNSTDHQRLKKKVKNETSVSDALVKYINQILSEYLGVQQEDKLKKYTFTTPQIKHLETYAAELVEAGFGRIVEAEIRVNHKNNRQAFISVSTDRESSEKDAIIMLPVARRYAFDGDVVRAFVFNSAGKNSNTIADNPLSLADNEELIDISGCTKAFVVTIVNQIERREVVGSIDFMTTSTLDSKPYYKLQPHNMKLPMIYIAQDLLLKEVGMLYVARVLKTDDSGHCIGELVQPIGKVGNLEAEIKCILLNNGLKNLEPYEQKFNDMFEGPITPINVENREDMRKKCVFTIDPLTAKDLDDAVSVEKLSNSEYEIGVHISDVSFYLEEDTELDNLVKLRATSVYLVNQVIHMLPPSLCFRCSLLPGKDKLTFSVFWKWHTEKEELSAPRFTRSIINSCSKFAYEHAQKIIDNPMEELDADDLPNLQNGWTPHDIQWRVLLLNELSQKLKKRRFENGAISINNPKLRFEFDPKTGEPISYEVESRQDANYLIEEFMLLANQAVAKFIHDRFPNTSILRNHMPPSSKSLKALKDRLQSIGLEFDIRSSRSISDSMKRLVLEADDSNAAEACLSALLTKILTRANYYCSEGKVAEADFWHYGLSIPIYTHFTSPIRRYPDIMVHRLLAAALNYCPASQRTTEELHHLAKICSEQKLKAKAAGDNSIMLFFKRYVKAKQSITLKAVVIDMYKQMMNVLAIETGHTMQIDYNSNNIVVNTTNAPSSVSIVEKGSSMPPIKLQLFSTVDINIVLKKDKLCASLVISENEK